MSPTVLPRPTTATAVGAASTPAPRVAQIAACGCGQDLDVCHAGHCPRCGVTLRA